AARELVRDRLPRSLHLRPVHCYVPAYDAYPGGACGKLVDLGAVQQRLGGHTAPVEAGAAYFGALYERDLGAELRGPYRRNIAAGAAAYNEHAAALRGPGFRLGGVPGSRRDGRDAL